MIGSYEEIPYFAFEKEETRWIEGREETEVQRSKGMKMNEREDG